MITELLSEWHTETAKLSPGVQRVFVETLGLAAEGKTHMAFGQDYGTGGQPCLVNSVRNMITNNDELPTQLFGSIVRLFDKINGHISDDVAGTVSEIAAETLLRNFAELKPMPLPEIVEVAAAVGVYVEPSDDQMFMDWMQVNTVDPTVAKIEQPESVNVKGL